jgi:23S rRNA (cytosine1962-C5)-methyltransferase
VPESTPPSVSSGGGSTPPSVPMTPPQIPFEAPVGMVHGWPAQQSAVLVHSPPLSTQAPRHLLSTQGFPQQSALVAHEAPGGGGLAVQSTSFRVQRGMPTASRRQQRPGLLLQKLESAWLGPLGRQQLFAEPVHAPAGSVESVLQMVPAGLHTLRLSQRPNSWVGELFAQVMVRGSLLWPSCDGEPDQPQQSLSFRQSSWRGAQPVAPWQTLNPAAAPLGPQIFVQQLLLQSSPPLGHTVPFGMQLPFSMTGPQTPRAAPSAFWQLPPQQSKFSEHDSVCWRQNDTLPSQNPPLHDFEQHCALPVQALPAVLQIGLRGLQVLPPAPSVHAPPQHCSSVVQVWLSEMQRVAEHLLAMHELVQQSIGELQSSPACLQSGPPDSGGKSHFFVPGSHFELQHSSFVVQATSPPLHTGPPSPSWLAPSVSPPSSVGFGFGFTEPSPPVVEESPSPPSSSSPMPVSLPQPEITLTVMALADSARAAHISFFIPKPSSNTRLARGVSGVAIARGRAPVNLAMMREFSGSAGGSVTRGKILWERVVPHLRSFRRIAFSRMRADARALLWCAPPMDRARIWPNFRAADVLFEDEDLLAVTKPAGVPSQAAHLERPDDLVTRLRAFLGERDRREPYLGIHQRLDQDTSGVLLFSKRPEVNAALARQFEGRTVRKRYVAAVEGWSAASREVTLDDELEKGESGRMQVATRRGGPGRKRDRTRAVTHVRVQKRSGARALLELSLETGRTHQARVQLAHARAPIAGDTLYGGPPAPRLMLHAASLELEHPRTGKRLVVRAPVPRTFEAWLSAGDRGLGIYDDVAALDAALSLAVERRWGLGRSADRDPEERRTTAFRLVNEEGDALPGLAVDVYGEHLVAQLYVSEAWDDAARRDRVLDRLDALGFDGVYLKLRPKQANVLVDTRRDDLAPRAPVRGTPAPDEIEILEEGVPFAARLGDGLSTGIFLDQRPNRRLVRSMAKGLRVLNLFSYTCAFSVAAALGGAARTVSVDASVTALERGREAFVRLGLLESGEHLFAAEDAFAWLARAARKSERFDLVVLDPPSYSSTKKRRFVAESDYDDLVALVGKVMADGGKLLACVNHRGMTRSKLRRLVGQGLRDAGRDPLQVKDLPESSDFPPPPGRDPHMKSVLATVR